MAPKGRSRQSNMLPSSHRNPPSLDTMAATQEMTYAVALAAFNAAMAADARICVLDERRCL
jgi:hypothetical protein